MSDVGRARLVARALAVEAQTAVVMRALADADVDALLLKGPSIERWLYDPGEWRVAADVDLLVAPGRLAAAERLLKAQGFANRYDGVSPRWAPDHADEWRSDVWPVPVDLHRRLWGVAAHPDRAWETLWGGRAPLPVGGAEVPVLGEAGRALAVGLHAAHHGAGAGRPLRDLERAVTRLPPAVWMDAAALARDLDAEAGLAAGLGLVPVASTLRADLELRPGDAAPPAVEPLWALPDTGEALVRLSRTNGWRAKAALLRTEVLPSSGFMRTRAAYGPLARRGRVGLACAHAVRWAHLVRDIPAGVRAARRRG